MNIVFRKISLTPFSILIPHTSAYSDRLNANQLRHYETCNNCNICLKVTTLTWQFHFFRPATNEWTSAILRVLIKMYLNNQSITQISGKSKTIWIWMDINPQWILLYLSYWMSCPTHQCQVQYQYRVQIGLIAEFLIIIPCCSMAGTSTVPGAGVLLHELACVSQCQCATLAGAGGSKLDMALVMPGMTIV